jgi:DNA-directed RNA polymerase specialized sigma24 family protein
MRRLPVPQRTVLLLRYYADATDEAIAATLKCRRATVRSLASACPCRWWGVHALCGPRNCG